MNIGLCMGDPDRILKCNPNIRGYSECGRFKIFRARELYSPGRYPINNPPHNGCRFFIPDESKRSVKND